MIEESAEVNHRSQVQKRTLPKILLRFNNEPMPKTFKQALKDAVDDDKRVSMRSVHKKSGVSESKLKKVSADYTDTIKADEAIKIAAVFGQTVNAFVGEEDPSADLRRELCKRLSVPLTTPNHEILQRIEEKRLDVEEVERIAQRAAQQALTQDNGSIGNMIEKIEKFHTIYQTLKAEMDASGEEASLETIVQKVIERSEMIHDKSV